MPAQVRLTSLGHLDSHLMCCTAARSSLMRRHPFAFGFLCTFAFSASILTSASARAAGGFVAGKKERSVTLGGDSNGGGGAARRPANPPAPRINNGYSG